MCEACCGGTHLNSYAAGKWAADYRAKAVTNPTFLQGHVSEEEIHNIFTVIYQGNENLAFFGAAGIETYGDLVQRLEEIGH